MKNHQKSIITTILVVLVLGIGYFGTYGQWNKLSESNSQLEVSRQKNEELAKAKSDITNFVNRFESSTELATQASRALPVGDPDTAIILDNYAKLVEGSGLNLVLMNISESDNTSVAADNTILPVEINMELFGSYASFENFLLKFQQNLRLSDIVSLTVDSTEEVQDGRSLKFGIRIRTYYQK